MTEKILSKILEIGGRFVAYQKDAHNFDFEFSGVAFSVVVVCYSGSPGAFLYAGERCIGLLYDDGRNVEECLRCAIN